ncbi:MAG TPA: hypothetical protein VMD92_07355 [Acidobacteriaceae bacterium]|nr:hypothetical protein [Acidobacteriaceae bacterium]
MSTPPVVVRSSLFNLLPALYRLRDAQLAANAGYPMGPLQSLLSIVEEQTAILEDNIAQLYDDLFIETCAPWVVPYIGDLIGYQQINGIASAVDSPRAEVANTIGFRRRKGTVPVLEQLARDATGWGAHAVEFFEVLATTQCVRNHLRLQNYYAPDLRSWKPREFMDSGFDKTAHKVDVRRIPPAPDQEPVPGGMGRYNLQNIGIFLWSLNAYTLTEVPATAVSGNPQCFRFSTLGADMPLFHQATELPDETTTLAGPSNVPARLTRHLLCHDIRAITGKKQAPPVYYGPGLSLAIYSGGSLQDASRILVTDLSGNDGSWANLSQLSDTSKLPAGADTIAVDPRLGRIAIPPPPAGKKVSLSTFCCYGFNAAIGGGEYPRASSFTASPEQAIVRVPGDYPNIHEALAALSGDGVVEVSNSGVYSEPNGLDVSVRANGHIELRAADGSRPTLILGNTISVTGATISGVSGVESAFDLNGFLIAYAPPETTSKPPAALLYSPAAKANALTSLGITHCTFVPGWALESNGEPKTTSTGALTYPGPAVLDDSAGLAVTIAQSILGPLYLNAESTASLTDTILDARSSTGVAIVASIDSGTNVPVASGALTMNGCTVVGKVYASLLSLVSDCIFLAELTEADVSSTPPLWNAPLWSARHQQGCVRYSYVPTGAILPRQFQCVEQAPGTPAPMFYALQYGNPAYAKLLPTTDSSIREGADDGGEMGAYHSILAPQREADLLTRLAEYIPVGMEYGIFYES